MRLVIDTDPGHDDVLAILLALHFGDVVGLTTTFGNAPLEHTTHNALALIDSLAVDVPVHAGAEKPLVREAKFAGHVHGKDGLGGTSLPQPRLRLSGSDAPGFLLEEGTSDTWIIAIGPLTNLANAIRRDPEWPRRVAGISLMGGSTHGGNITAAAEFNIWADPEAADLVFRSGADIRMCGLNASHQVMSSDAWIDELRQLHTPRAEIAVDILVFMHEVMERLTGRRATALHDPCAVLAVTHPQLFTFQPRRVAVELRGEHTRGMTVVDERPLQQDGANALVAYEVDAAEARRLQGNSLSG